VTDISYPVASGTLRGYLATPATPGPWPGVVVLHEIFGLTDDIRRQADRFAERGYLALAPDLYDWGAKARCLVATLRSLGTGKGRALDDIQDARRFLAGRDDCTGSVGVVGFCLGGGFALLVANDGFAAAAPNYGQPPRRIDQAMAGSCPVVASYGQKDLMLRGAAAKIEAALDKNGVPNDVKEYPGVKHGFLFEHTGKASITEPLMVKYDAAAAADAWDRIFTFFDQHLRGTA
jgi:carboxymethylenebutenolidase